MALNSSKLFYEENQLHCLYYYLIKRLYFSSWSAAIQGISVRISYLGLRKGQDLISLLITTGVLNTLKLCFKSIYIYMICSQYMIDVFLFLANKRF